MSFLWFSSDGEVVRGAEDYGGVAAEDYVGVFLAMIVRDAVGVRHLSASTQKGGTRHPPSLGIRHRATS